MNLDMVIIATFVCVVILLGIRLTEFVRQRMLSRLWTERFAHMFEDEDNVDEDE